MRRLLSALLALFFVARLAHPAFADTPLAITHPTQISYDPTTDSFPVNDLSLSGSVSYAQVGLTLVDQLGNPLDATSGFAIATGNQCQFDINWDDSGATSNLTLSGDQTTNVIIAGELGALQSILTHVWIYKTGSSFCSGGSAQTLGGQILTASLQVSAIESQAGLLWSPATHHFYKLETQTTDDGMGQPTDDAGNITDSSRWFVRWSTARAEAKQQSITINGASHRGYLAAITTKAEFDFLNNNVSGGRGKLYPAWVGGSDQAQEGIWNWVDGPEAAQFGGDTLTHDVAGFTDPEGRALQRDGGGYAYLNYGGFSSYSESWALMMRDDQGNYVTDLNTGYKLSVRFDWDGYCSMYYQNIPGWEYEEDATPYGSTVVCDPAGFYVRDANGNRYDQEYSNSYTDGFIYHLESDSGVRTQSANGDFLVVQTLTSDFISGGAQTLPNYGGAQFYGTANGLSIPDPWNSPDICTQRGTRGICYVSQADVYGGWQYNGYYVNWSNGDKSNYANWDGTGPKTGDGAYGPQPDNAFLNGSPEGENALIINWCTRNPSDYSNSDAVVESLYGNSGYHCTPGWNDLAAGDWGGASATYPNWTNVDTPNQIGTTDFVVEFCGYSDEQACDTDPSDIVAIGFTPSDSTCGQSTDTKLTTTFEPAGVENTSSQTSTMNVLTFDQYPTGWLPDPTLTSIGVINGNMPVGSANDVGGAGGIGNYAAPSDAWLTLPTLSCYLGLWWSAGNADNYVSFYDAHDNLLAGFNAADLVTNLGACDGANPYCGHPNFVYPGGVHGDPNELFAFVNFRIPAGFKKIHLSGRGFELDNITTSVQMPTRSSGETTVSNSDVRLDCSTIDADAANTTLVACPRTISVQAGQQLTYSPTLDSEIYGYVYPGDVQVSAAVLHSGDAVVSLDQLQNWLILNSSTVGQFTVDFTISRNGQTATSRLTVNVTAGAPPTYNAPTVLLVDPRSATVQLPTLNIDAGGADVTLCLAQVDSDGNFIAGAPDLQFDRQWPNNGATANSLDVFTTFSGLDSAVSADSGLINVDLISASQYSAWYFFKFGVVSGSAPSATDCSTAAQNFVIIKPIDLDSAQELNIDIQP